MTERLVETHPLMHRLTARRLDLGRSQMKIAAAVGVSQITLCYWETGHRRPTIPKFARLADALDCEITITPKEDRMGTSTDAILAYGYDLGEWDKIREAGEFGELSLDWIDDDCDDGYTDQAERRLLIASGFTETWETKQGNGYHGRKEEAKAALGVQFETYCSDNAPMHVLAAKVITVSRGDCEVLDLLALAAESVEHGWDDTLRAACATLGITPTQEQPGWVLVSYWGQGDATRTRPRPGRLGRLQDGPARRPQARRRGRPRPAGRHQPLRAARRVHR